MARRAGPWYRASHRMWYATIDSNQVSLKIRGEENEAAAQVAYQALINPAVTTVTIPTSVPPIPEPPPARAGTVSEATAEFLAARKPKISTDCWVTYEIALRHFVATFGGQSLSSLAGEAIEDWANQSVEKSGERIPRWSSSTQHDYLGVVQTFLKWAKHPIPIKRPPKESRGAEAVLTDEQFAQVVAKAGAGDFPNLLRVLRETGSRPQEIARLTVDGMDWKNCCLRTKVHKNKKHGRERIIHFNSEAMRVLEEQRAKYPTGLLFRSRDGVQFTKDAIVQRMIRITKKLGFHATAYMGRHSFATAALVSGVPDAIVAELLGHKGTAMIAKHYGHVGGQSRVLKDAVEKMRQKSHLN